MSDHEKHAEEFMASLEKLLLETIKLNPDGMAKVFHVRQDLRYLLSNLLREARANGEWDGRKQALEEARRKLGEMT